MATLQDANPPYLGLAEQASAPATPAAGYGRLYVANDGTLHFVNDAGADIALGGGAASALVDIAKAIRSTGDITLNTTGWQNVDTALDLTLVGAQVGDEIEYLPSFLVQAPNNALAFDACTLVGGTPVNYFGTAGGAPDNGLLAWYAVGNVAVSVGGSGLYTVQAGDISGGNVTVRLRVRPANTTSRAISASAATPLRVAAKLLRPAA